MEPFFLSFSGSRCLVFGFCFCFIKINGLSQFPSKELYSVCLCHVYVLCAAF